MRKKPDESILKEIDKLFISAKENSRKKIEVSRKKIALARKIAKRSNISLKKYKKKFCHKCNTYFVQRENYKKRLSKRKISIKCLNCGNYSRYIFKKRKIKMKGGK